MAKANQIIAQLRQGASFAGYARQYSEASTAAVGGDLGWVRPEQLPDAACGRVPANGAGPDQPADPGPGRRFDRRGPGCPQDPLRRSAQCRPQPQAGFDHLPGRERRGSTPKPMVAQFAQAARNVGGCGGADKIAADFNGEVVQSDKSSFASFRLHCRK